MCGIAGFSIKPGYVSAKRIRQLRNFLAIEMMPRGRQATGIASWAPNATWSPTNPVWFHKSDVDAQELIKEIDTDTTSDLHKAMLGTTQLIHTRQATTGSPKVNHNNHPIIAENIVGIHNGMLMCHTTDAKLLNVDLEYEVDSELLFRIVEKYSDFVDAEGEITPTYRDLWTKVDGDASVAWINTKTKYLHLAALGGRPFYVADITVGGMLTTTVGVVFASTKEALTKADSIRGFGIANIRELEVGNELVYNDQGELVEQVKCKVLNKVTNYNWAAAEGGTRTRWSASTSTTPYVSSMASKYKYYNSSTAVPLDIMMQLSNNVSNLVKNGYMLQTLPNSTYRCDDGIFFFNDDVAEEYNLAYSTGYQSFIMQSNGGRTLIYLPKTVVEEEFRVSIAAEIQKTLDVDSEIVLGEVV